MLKVSFDFDSTLSEDYIQVICKTFLEKPDVFDVYVVTSRHNNLFHRNTDLFKITDQLGIDRSKISFTDGDFKFKTLKVLGIDIHFDDMPDEVLFCFQNDIKGILVNFEDLNYIKYLL